MTSIEDYSLQSGVRRINSMKQQKFGQLCEHIISAMIEDKPNTEIFTDAQINQLCKMLDFERSNLLLVVDCVTYIYRECALLRGVKKIAKFLQDIGLAETYMEAVVLVWKSYGAKYLSIVKDKTVNLTSGSKFEGFNWKLSLPIAKSGTKSTKWGELMPNSRAAVADLEFTVDGEKVGIELTKTQLQGMYEEFEKIQMKIDELTK